MEILYGILELVLLGLGIFLLIKIITAPIKLIFKILLNALLGWLILFVINLIGSVFGFKIDVNFLTSLIAGAFGAPGVIVLILLKILF